MSETASAGAPALPNPRFVSASGRALPTAHDRSFIPYPLGLDPKFEKCLPDTELQEGVPWASGPMPARAFSNDAHDPGGKTGEARKDLIAAREVVLALDFCLAVISWYESNRIDRSEVFVFRLTPELRHDILSYLVSRQTDPKAIYLFLEALFVRTATTPKTALVPDSVGEGAPSSA